MRTPRSAHDELQRLGTARALPAPPPRPVPGECCDRGCEPCIWDYYERGVTRWCARHGVDRPDRVTANGGTEG